MTTFVLVGEDECHWSTVTKWTDVLLKHFVSWMAEQESLNTFREWIVDDEARLHGKPYLTVASSKGFGRSRRSHGAFGRDGALPDAKATVDRLLRAQEISPTPDVVFLCRDTDDEPSRRAGALQALTTEGRTWPFDVVLAIANPEMEAWRVAAWRPANLQDRNTHRALVDDLGFDPVTTPTRLTSKPHLPAEAKTVASRLQVESTWMDTPAAHLVGLRTEGLGLAEFVQDIERKVAPLLGHPAPVR